MHIYTLCPSLLQIFTKFRWAVSEELCWQTVLSSFFHFGQISKIKKRVTREKKLNQNFLWICTSIWYVLHKDKASWKSVERLKCSCADKLFRSIFHFCQISMFKKGIITGKKLNQNFLWICTSTHMPFITKKFHEILLSGFRRVALTRKTGLTDWLTDWRTGQKHNTLRNSLRGV